MYDLHCHSLLSDGLLLPSEVAARYQAAGYKVIAICDHADYSNIEMVVDGVLSFARQWPKEAKIKVLAGIELTHLPLSQFKPLAQYARKKGIKIIIGHGETITEPVVQGTNRACMEAGIDILAHPGLIREEDVRLAKQRGVFLEITSRRGHRDTNPHVAELALKSGARLILNNDSHTPEDIITPSELRNYGFKAGLTEAETKTVYEEVERFLEAKI